MSTNVVQNLDTTVTLAASQYPCLDTSVFALIDTAVVDKQGGRESLYGRTDAATEYPVELRVGHYPKVDDKGAKYFNNSVRLDVWNKYTDDDGDVVYELDPITVSWKSQRESAPDAAAGYATALLNLISVLFGNVTAGVPDYDGMSKLARGITNLGLADLTRT